MRHGRPILATGLILALLGHSQAAQYFRFNPSTLATGQSGGSPTPATNSDPSTGLALTVPCTGCSTRVQRSYSLQPTANGPVTGWSLSAGQIPPGMQLDGGTGLVSGTPSAPGAYTFVLAAGQPSGQPLQAPLVRLAVNALPTLSYASSSGNGGRTLNLAPTLRGALGTGTYKLTSGSLPAPLTLDETSGVISGPVQASVASLKVTYTDVDGAVATSDPFDILASSSPILSYPGSAYSGRVGATFATITPTLYALAASPNVRVSGGSLPPGLRVDPTTGVVSGSPTVSGNYPSVSFAANAANGATVTSNALSFSVGQASVSYPSTAGQVGKALSLSPTVGYLDAPQFSLNTGTLPAGVGLAQGTGIISGTPTASGSFPLTVLAYDQGLNQAVSPTFSLTIAPATLTATPSSVPLIEGSPVALNATTSLSSPTWSVSGNPPWMTFVQTGDTYAASGVSADVPPGAAQSYTVALKAVDPNGATAQANVPVSVSPATVTVADAAVRSGSAFTAKVTETMVATGNWSVTSSPADVANLAVSGANLTGTAPANAGPNPATRSLNASYTASAAPSSGATATASGTGTLTVQPPLAIAAQAASTFYFKQAVNLAAPTLQGRVGSPTWSLYSGATNVSTTLGQTCTGLGFTPSTGAINGSPTAPCSVSLSYAATDPGDGLQIPSSSATSQPFTLTVNAPTVTTSVPSVQIGEGQIAAFTATTNLPNPTWSLAGNTPAWMTITSSGSTATVSSVSGDEPGTAVNYYYPAVTASSNGASVSSTVQVQVTPATASVTTPNVVHGGQPFSVTGTTNMKVPGTWRMTASAPDVTNITVNGNVISGVAPPNTSTVNVLARTLNASFVANDAPSTGTAATAAAAAVTLSVYPPLSVTMPSAITAYTRANVTMANATYRWNVGTLSWSTPSRLPAGLSVDPTTGKLVGQATEMGTFPVAFVAQDSDGTTATSNSTLTVNSGDPVLTMADSSTGSTINGAAYSNGATFNMPTTTSAQYQNYGFWIKNNGPNDATDLHFSVYGDSNNPDAFFYGSSDVVHEYSPGTTNGSYCTSILAVNKTCYFIVGFRPTSNGQWNGTVRVGASNMAQQAGFNLSVPTDKIVPAGRMFVYAAAGYQTVQIPSATKYIRARYFLVSGGNPGFSGYPTGGGSGPVVIAGEVYSTPTGTMQALVGKGMTYGPNGDNTSSLRTDFNAPAANIAYAAFTGPYSKSAISGGGGRTDSTPQGMAYGYAGGAGTVGGGTYATGYVSGGPYKQDLTGGVGVLPTYKYMKWSYGTPGNGGGQGPKCSGPDSYIIAGSGGGAGIVFDGNNVNVGSTNGSGGYAGTAGTGYGAGGGGGTGGPTNCGVQTGVGGNGADGILYLEWDTQ